jgi:hypothetical protein
MRILWLVAISWLAGCGSAQPSCSLDGVWTGNGSDGKTVALAFSGSAVSVMRSTGTSSCRWTLSDTSFVIQCAGSGASYTLLFDRTCKAIYLTGDELRVFDIDNTLLVHQ